MVVFQTGNIAGIGWEKYESVEKMAFWVRGYKQKLSSSSFGSCVGLVLCVGSPGYGAVAHFWNPSALDDAKIIVDDYNRWLFTETVTAATMLKPWCLAEQLWPRTKSPDASECPSPVTLKHAGRWL